MSSSPALHCVSYMLPEGSHGQALETNRVLSRGMHQHSPYVGGDPPPAWMPFSPLLGELSLGGEGFLTLLGPWHACSEASPWDTLGDLSGHQPPILPTYFELHIWTFCWLRALKDEDFRISPFVHPPPPSADYVSIGFFAPMTFILSSVPFPSIA